MKQSLKQLWIRKRMVLLGITFVFLMASLALYLQAAWPLEDRKTTTAPARPAYTKVNTAKKTVYITIDTSLGANYTEQILSVLQKKKVKATFALLGLFMEENQPLIARIADDGHQVMSHTMAHPHYDTLGATEIIEDATAARNVIEEQTGRECTLIRPPYQACSLSTSQILFDAGFIPVLFSIDARDYTGVSPEAVASQILNCVKPGDIIVFQNNSGASAAAIGMLIDQLKELGYSFGVLDAALFV